MNNQEQREEKIFDAALRLATPAERAAYLKGACGDDEPMRYRVEALLQAHDQAGTFLEKPAPGAQIPGPASLPSLPAADVGIGAPTEQAGERIGRYKLLQKIGEGGCGTVYMAEQEEPVRRRVALKIIKLGMDTKQVIARFEAERQALALMDHPNIAKVLDAGATDTGRPYFVMELVRGIRITDYCDQNNLSTLKRLDLFIQVCHAIQHAHQKGIIHRDIKPSNILVTLHDGVPVPKVIDFGIAKATTDQRLTDKTLFTAFEQFIGTPAYMSPEQAEMSGLDIDTRSDIYSLGVLLYELLTGKTPFDATTLLQVGLDEMRRIIREQEPVRPSTRLSTELVAADVRTLEWSATGKPASEEEIRASSSRLLQIKELINLLRGDLDWIVMKSLEKDRTHRYQTASGLAADIQRHLNNEPVIARPPSTAYKVQKFVRRNKVMVTAAAVVATALVVGMFLSTWQAMRATRAEREQRRLRAEAEKARVGEAAQRRQAQKAQANETQLRRQVEVTGEHLRETLNQLQLQRVEQLFDAGDSSTALAHLAGVLRQNPSNRVAAERMISALTHRSFALPINGPLTEQGSLSQLSPDGQLMVTASGNVARVWDSNTGQPLTEPLRHDSLVSSLEFAPDGQRVIVASGNTARVWDAHTGQPVTAPIKHESAITFVQFSPDGSRVATASLDMTARIWDAQTGRPLTESLAHKREVNCVQFSPDGQLVVTAAHDGTARVWNARTGQPAAKSLTHSGIVWSARFSPDGQRIVTASQDNTARVWDAKTGLPLGPPLQDQRPVRSAEFSPNGRRVLTASTHARVWNAITGQPVPLPLEEEGSICCARYSLNGQRIVTTSKSLNPTARVWNSRTGAPLTERIGHESASGCAQFSLDGERLMTASGLTWDAKPGQSFTEPLRHQAMVWSCQFSPDGQRVVTASDDHTARIWDTTTGQPLTEPLKHDAVVWSAEFSPDGRWVLTASTGGARVWEAKTGQPLTEWLKHQGSGFTINSARFSPDGQRVVTASTDKTARIWDARTGQPLTEPLKHDAVVYSGRFSPDGQRLVTVSEDNTARVWDVKTGRSLTEPLKHDDHVRFAEFSPDGKRIVTASRDNTARIWDATTGQPLTAPLQHEEPVESARFDSDGQRVVTASLDGTARIWDAKTGQPLTGPLKHAHPVGSARFSPDGNRVVTASFIDGIARVWDALTGQPLTEPIEHGAYSAQFSPDGQRITASDGSAARVWDVPAVPLPVPEWFPKLAEAVAGKRINDKGLPETVAPVEFLALKRQLLVAAPSGPWAHWAKWFLADRATRTISPFSEITVPKYVQRRINENTLESLQEAVLLAPTNSVALGGLARAVLVHEPPRSPRLIGQGEW
jgi:WD40 repeat protein/serine/threonine protein kinase